MILVVILDDGLNFRDYRDAYKKKLFNRCLYI